ncbi:hypothetical protein RS84_00262 [Microbacterium hydrocarbonoxydans]|uniref:Uncharacterized protein n=1 Tax=Microbacterium hydrocarbonoxydans TaxID=273678 RepID=A0A0M2HW52_9MICO|nr:hypothetical protein [Microbacterium hydrocarbonoxydans]KJL49150.1 hypothetical protein RS84_00262 [Microbacterium hydrocarbonoxydans]
MDWWVTPLVTLLVAVVGLSGVALTVWATRRAQQQSRLEAAEKRADVNAQRVLKLINYSARLRDAIYRGDKPPPEEWPEDIYD